MDRVILSTHNDGEPPSGQGPAESARTLNNDIEAIDLSLIEPEPGQNYGLDTPITMAVVIRSGSPDQVHFLVDGDIACSSTDAPFSCQWTPPGPGQYNITAVALAEGVEFASNTVTISAGVDSAGHFIGSNGLVVVEGENYHTAIDRGHYSWQAASDLTGHSGSGFMQGLPDAGVTFREDIPLVSPEVAYDIFFDRPGEYHVWIRGWSDHTGSDSVHVGIDGVPSQRITMKADHWNWARKEVQVRTSGLHRLNLWVREDGVRVDKVLLTTDGEFLPSDKGPDESPRANGIAGRTALLSAPPTSAIDPPAQTFRDWRLLHFSAADLKNVNIGHLSADPDRDQVTNLAEYLFGLNPWKVDHKMAGAPFQNLLDDGSYEISYPWNHAVSDIEIVMEVTDRLDRKFQPVDDYFTSLEIGKTFVTGYEVTRTFKPGKKRNNDRYYFRLAFRPREN
ncbi:MAG: Ig-like domain-containing protein [Verrucomicrobiota bacterium]